LPDNDPNDGTTTEKKVWTQCQHNAEIVQYVINGGEHEWPVITNPAIKETCEQLKRCPPLDFSASEEIWTFFSHHSLLSMRRNNRSLWFAVLILLGVVAWLTYHFPHNSLWYDEALTTYVATDSWQTLIRWCTQVDIQVPFHYVALRLWTDVVGDSEFTLRLLSALCVVLVPLELSPLVDSWRGAGALAM
jgi:hypothetical protein